MKKIISLALVCVMMLAMLSVASFAEEVTFTVEKYGEGMENWAGSPNLGDQSAQTQVLICPQTTDGAKLAAAYENYTEIEWTLKFTDTNGVTKTVNLKPASCYDGGTWGILRFEPCLGTGVNKFVPAEGMTYTVEASFTAGGVTYKGVSADGYFKNKDGAAVDPDPSVPVIPDEVPAPPTGDTAVFAIVFAAVAMLGMAVVVTKKVNA